MGKYRLDYFSKYYFYEEDKFSQEVEEGDYLLDQIKKSNRFDYKGHSYKYTKFGNISKSYTQRDVEVEIPQDDINVIINGESAHLDYISCILYIDYNQGNEFVKELEGVKKAQQENMNK